jgi:AraC-like DNA-binding protein
VLVGPSTSYHTDIELGGDSDTFTIKFQPTAMQRLFGLPGSILVDLAEDAPAVESGFRALRRLLDGTQNFGERIAIAQDWLRGRLASVRPANAIDRAARLVRRSSGQIDLDRLAQACAMSPRNFRRCFADAVGVSPKLYSRITRLHAALELKDRQPDLPWTHVSQRLGYFDQSHMLRDMRVFAGGMDIPGRYKARSSDAVSDISYSPRQS